MSIYWATVTVLHVSATTGMYVRDICLISVEVSLYRCTTSCMPWVRGWVFHIWAYCGFKSIGDTCEAGWVIHTYAWADKYSPKCDSMYVAYNMNVGWMWVRCMCIKVSEYECWLLLNQSGTHLWPVLAASLWIGVAFSDLCHLWLKVSHCLSNITYEERNAQHLPTPSHMRPTLLKSQLAHHCSRIK